MPILNLEQPAFISVDGAGRPNAGGTVEVYVADGTFTTYATIYSDQVKTSVLANPVTLSDAGTTEIWYEVKVDIREKTKASVLIRDTLNLDPNANQASTTGFNLAQNGSFEIDSTNDGQPDSWTISPYTGSAIAITNDVVTDGVEALEFNTGAAGSGGGTATSAKFPVTEGTVLSVNFSFYATHATTTNTFVIKWYDEDSTYISEDSVTMPASGSVPTSWTEYTEEITVAATATQGEIVLVGIASGGSNLSSKAYFDGIKLVNMTNLVTLAGTQNIKNKTIVDTNDNEVLKFGTTASAVNEITITNAATATRPTIASSGEADIGIDFENDQGEEILELIPVATAINNITITNAVTTESAKISCSETNADTALIRNGTGDILVDSTPIYGMVFLSTPVNVVTGVTTATTGTINNATLASVEATAAIFHVEITATSSAAGGYAEMYLADTSAKAGGFSQIYRKLYVATDYQTSAHDYSGSVECVVLLDGSYDCFWSTRVSTSTFNMEINLVGYYV